MNKALSFSYLLFSFFVVSFSFLFVDPNLIYLKLLFSNIAYQHRVFVTLLYIFIIVLFFTFYFLFLQRYQRNKFIDRRIFLITALVFLFSYPAMVSFDIFNYIATAKVLFHYHENPYIIMPIEFTGDPLLLFMHAANKTALYGFIWIILTGIPFILSFGNFLLILFNFKLFITFFYLATLILIWKISKNIQSVYLFGLNPLVIIETLMSAHNDIVSVLFSLLAYYLLQKKKIYLAIIIFLFSVFIKYATIFLIPVFLYALIKTIEKKEIKWDKIFLFSALIMMFVVFFISPIREEIYPWYALWFLAFVALIPSRKILLNISIAASFGLLLRYVPFMLLGTYFGLTPVIKLAVTFTPLLLVCAYFSYKYLLWQKHISSRH